MIRLSAVALGAALLLSGCADSFEGIKFGSFETTVTATPTPVIEAKPVPVVKLKAPAQCHPDAIAAAAKVAKVDGNQTPPEAVEKAYDVTAQRLGSAKGASRACYCWMASTGLVEADAAQLDKMCKPLPAAKPTKAAKK